MDLYNRLLVDPIDNKKKFLNYVAKYENFSAYSVVNSVHFDVTKSFLRTVRDVFGLKAENPKQLQTPDLSEQYRRHEAAFKQSATDMPGVVESQVAEFLESPNSRSLLYFGEIDHLISEFRRKYCTQTINTPNRPNARSTEVYGQHLQYISLEDLHTQLTNNLGGPGIKAIEVSPNSPKAVKEKRGGGGGGGGGSRRKETEESGFIGECLVYNLLVNEHGRENVEWVSQYAAKCGVNEKGSDSAHYDIGYIDRDGRKIYVEVKSSTDDKFIFHITKDEVTLGERYKDNYEIYLVSGIRDTGMKVMKLRQFFKYRRGETFTSNAKFVVENDSFVIRFE